MFELAVARCGFFTGQWRCRYLQSLYNANIMLFLLFFTHHWCLQVQSSSSSSWSGFFPGFKWAGGALNRQTAALLFLCGSFWQLLSRRAVLATTQRHHIAQRCNCSYKCFFVIKQLNIRLDHFLIFEDSKWNELCKNIDTRNNANCRRQLFVPDICVTFLMIIIVYRLYQGSCCLRDICAIICVWWHVNIDLHI